MLGYKRCKALTRCGFFAELKAAALSQLLTCCVPFPALLFDPVEKDLRNCLFVHLLPCAHFLKDSDGKDRNVSIGWKPEKQAPFELGKLKVPPLDSFFQRSDLSLKSMSLPERALLSTLTSSVSSRGG